MGKPRYWALILSFFLFLVLGQANFLFLETVPEQAGSAFVFNILGTVAGALFLPVLLPLGLLRKNVCPGGFKRITAVGFLFVPGIAVRLFGLQAWLAGPVNVAVMTFSTGILVTLTFGLFITLVVKNRVFWSCLSIGFSHFFFNLLKGLENQIPFELFQSIVFYMPVLTNALTGFFTVLFLLSMKGEKMEMSDGGLPESNGMFSRLKSALLPLLPLAAVIIVLWANSFTNRLFFPIYNLPFGAGLHPHIILFITAIIILGFIAGRFWQGFLKLSIPLCFALFVFFPSLLFFNGLEPLFLVLYTLNVIAINMIAGVFPFIISDLYWKVPASGHNFKGLSAGYWAYLLAVSINVFRYISISQRGLFKPFTLDNAYAVVMLSVIAFAFFILSRLSVKALTVDNFEDGNLSDSSLSVMPETPAGGFTAQSLEGYDLSKRETEIAALILHGKEYREIAKGLFLSELTVKKHVSNIYKKCNVKKRHEFMAKVLR